MAKSNNGSGINKFLADTSKYAGKRSDMVPPKSGSYAAPKADSAQNSYEAIPSSAWPDRKGNSAGLSSKQPAAKYGSEATSTDNSYAKSLIASDTSNQRVDRSGSFFRK